MPLNVVVTKVVRVGSQLLSVGGGLKYWVEGPSGGPKDLGFRVSVPLLFPK